MFFEYDDLIAMKAEKEEELGKKEELEKNEELEKKEVKSQLQFKKITYIYILGGCYF